MTQRRPAPRTSRGPIAGALAAVAVIMALAACASSSGTSSAPAAAAPVLPPPPTAVALAPLKLAAFPSTPGGKEARGICQAWLGLRQQYENRMVADSPHQLNQWFSSRAWAKTQDDGTALGDDPAYAHLETALGEAVTGDMAGAGTVKLMDSACAKGD
jgi:hypothetical protein